MRQILTPDDLKKGDLIPPGWYPAEITLYEEKTADSDKSTNCIFHFKVLEPEQFRGISPRSMFNEKALGYGKNLWATLNLPRDAAGNYDLSTELFKKTEGFKLQINIQRGKSNKDNEFNEIKDYRPIPVK